MMNTKILLAVSALALASLGPSVRADDGMAGMNMSGTTMAPQSASLSVTATVKPNPPHAGDNALDLMVTDAAGKPVPGLKLSASVAMTSMDMGTTHPAFTDAGNGHYTAIVTFGMDGPWRVTVRSQKAKLAVLDFDAGGKTAWKSPQTKAAAAPPATEKPADTSMAGMNMGNGDGATPVAAPKTGGSPDGMPGIDMGQGSGMSGMDMSSAGKSGTMDMQTAKVPHLQETGAYTTTGQENWKVQTGFGHNSGMVGMMIGMMVGGSGMEGMKMPSMKMDFGPKNFTPTEDDTDAGGMAGMDMGAGGKAAQGNTDKPAPKDGMAGMNMPAMAPALKEAAPAPKAAAGAGQPMAGMTMPAPSPSVGASGNASDASPWTITTTLSKAKVGDNALTITVADAAGKPITGAKVTTSVAMTSMDMGTTRPPVKELGGGRYATTVAFGMAGPWRVTVRASGAGRKPQIKTFDFAAK